MTTESLSPVFQKPQDYPNRGHEPAQACEGRQMLRPFVTSRGLKPAARGPNTGWTRVPHVSQPAARPSRRKIRHEGKPLNGNDGASERGRPHRFSAFVAAACAVVLLGAPSRSSARIIVDIVRIGVPAGPSGMIRSGAWVPVVVDVSTDSVGVFDGTLRVSQLDTDGDFCYDSVEVHLRGEPGETLRKFLFVPANPSHRASRFAVELRNRDGEVVEVIAEGEPVTTVLPTLSPDVIDKDALVILSISSGTMSHVSDLIEADQQDMFARPIVVGHMSPTDLPPLWIGLEAVDVIVWDAADPNDLGPAQVKSLLDWIGHGGTLLIAASRKADNFRANKSLYRVLPVDIGEVIQVTELPNVQRRFHDAKEGGFDRPIPIVRVTPRPGARVVAREFKLDGGEGETPIIVRHVVGRGHVIFCAVALKDLFSAGKGSPANFFKVALQLAPMEVAIEEQAMPVSLFNEVVAAVAFSARSGIYFLVALLFSFAYVGIATFGSWTFLKSRSWLQHSWSAFALVAIASSFLSVIAVGAVNGIGDKLHQISIVDVDAGKRFGHGTAFFGLKTSREKWLDLWLPEDHTTLGDGPGVSACFLRPIPASSELGASTNEFADPERYRLVPGSAVLGDSRTGAAARSAEVPMEGVKFRATLKRFEGRWEGPLQGRLTGNVQISGGLISPRSYIINDLGVDLTGCYLLHARIEQAGTRRTGAYAYKIGDVPSNNRTKVFLAPRCYQVVGPETVKDAIKDLELGKMQAQWSIPFVSGLRGLGMGGRGEEAFALGKEQDALLLLSTIGDFDPGVIAGGFGQMFGRKTWSRDRMRQLDLKDRLTTDAVILIGFSNEPGPIRLAYRRNGRGDFRVVPVESGHAHTMYRIRIPITSGTAGGSAGATAGGDPDEDVKEPYEP